MYCLYLRCLAMQAMLLQLNSSAVLQTGRQILADKPRITEASIDLPRLRTLPPSTFGRQYAHYLDQHQFSPVYSPPYQRAEGSEQKADGGVSGERAAVSRNRAASEQREHQAETRVSCEQRTTSSGRNEEMSELMSANIGYCVAWLPRHHRF